MSLVCCQIKAWKAGHQRECAAAPPTGTRPAAKPTADQMRVLKILEQLAGAADWRGVAAQERAARVCVCVFYYWAVAAAVRTSMPGVASSVYCTLGIVFHSLEDYFKAIEYDMEHLT